MAVLIPWTQSYLSWDGSSTKGLGKIRARDEDEWSIIQFAALPLPSHTPLWPAVLPCIKENIKKSIGSHKRDRQICHYHLFILSCCWISLVDTPVLEETIAFLLKTMWSKEQKCLELLRENETSTWSGTNRGKRSFHLSKKYVVTRFYREACPSSQGGGSPHVY